MQKSARTLRDATVQTFVSSDKKNVVKDIITKYEKDNGKGNVSLLCTYDTDSKGNISDEFEFSCISLGNQLNDVFMNDSMPAKLYNEDPLKYIVITVKVQDPLSPDESYGSSSMVPRTVLFGDNKKPLYSIEK